MKCLNCKKNKAELKDGIVICSDCGIKVDYWMYLALQNDRWKKDGTGQE